MEKIETMKKKRKINVNKKIFKPQYVYSENVHSENITEGNLIIIGGAEDKKGDKDILKEVCSRINKNTDYIVIAAMASSTPDELGTLYKGLFLGLGVNYISLLNVSKRSDCFEKNNIDMIKKASLIFFTGGDQLKISSFLGGTPLFEEMKKCYEKGCIFAGTSAGASVMSDTMIVSGPDEEAPRKCTLKMAPGLGFIKHVIIDQHFAQRGRIGRLMTGIAENPESLGIGIDEDTAIVINRGAEFKVMGSGSVYVLDGSSITHSNVSEQYPDEVLSIFNVHIHVLKKGNRFDLKSKLPFD